MSDNDHRDTVRRRLKAMKPGEKRAFFYVRDGDRHVLHVSAKDGSSERFSTRKKVNGFLHSKRLSDPVGDRAPMVAGKVVLEDGTLFFGVKHKKDLEAAAFKEGMRTLKALTRPHKVLVGEVSDEDALNAGRSATLQGAEGARTSLDGLQQRVEEALVDPAASHEDIRALLDSVRAEGNGVVDGTEALILVLEAEAEAREARAAEVWELEQALTRFEGLIGTHTSPPVEAAEELVAQARRWLGASAHRPRGSRELVQALKAVEERLLPVAEEMRKAHTALLGRVSRVLDDPREVSDRTLARSLELIRDYLRRFEDAPFDVQAHGQTRELYAGIRAEQQRRSGEGGEDPLTAYKDVKFQLDHFFRDPHAVGLEELDRQIQRGEALRPGLPRREARKLRDDLDMARAELAILLSGKPEDMRRLLARDEEARARLEGELAAQQEQLAEYRQAPEEVDELQFQRLLIRTLRLAEVAPPDEADRLREEAGWLQEQQPRWSRNLMRDGRLDLKGNPERERISERYQGLLVDHWRILSAPEAAGWDQMGRVQEEVRALKAEVSTWPFLQTLLPELEAMEAALSSLVTDLGRVRRPRGEIVQAYKDLKVEATFRQVKELEQARAALPPEGAAHEQLKDRALALIDSVLDEGDVLLKDHRMGDKRREKLTALLDELYEVYNTWSSPG